ncbi:MAG TPA: hypothetical protein VE136_16165 [Anaerolineales bacterium]|nr:hypothetical protein [Anaerolineales bacterium]
MTTLKMLDSRKMAFLFDMKLHYRKEKPPVTMDGKLGEYIGSGDGTLNGLRINGNVHWTLFEAQTETVCPANLIGLITTDDNAEIKLDAIGFFMRPDPADPYRWVNSAAIRFVTADERYAWLNSILGVWRGETDGRIWRHDIQVHAISA